MAKKVQSREVSQAEIRSTFEGALETADALRLKALAEVSTFRRVKGVGLAREQKRIYELDSHDQRLARVSESNVKNIALIREVDDERLRTESLAEEVGGDESVINGHVRNEAGVATAGLTVRLRSDGDKSGKGLPSATTDENGYFVLRTSRIDDAASKESRTKATLTRLEVLDEKGRIIAAPQPTLELVAGELEYRAISISGNVRESNPADSSPARYMVDLEKKVIHDTASKAFSVETSGVRSGRRAYFESFDQACRLGNKPCRNCIGRKARR